ncbi:NAD(P)H-dependent FMN reductase LOT6-like [Bradysia coprophila]|uniref:NAD(P)H-dependent FMN reductase LOT6-like n=1 Tax=Bradysia coprophila TaxID=38358 RepID=UPI00187D9ACA|nr:NAD(P)H-dependent FMN reductase LOT6-like [Bradysia coprophila]
MDVIRICILVGSARTGGNSIGISKWVNNVLDDLLQDSSYGITKSNITIIDPHTKPHPTHPVLDEIIPALRQDSTSYSSQEVREWSEFIQSCNALIVVTPQYNWGYPSTLKLAIDVLYREWRAKPAAVITLGGHGGSKCDEQLRQVMAGVKMDTVEQRVQITLPEQYIRGNERVTPSEERDTFLEDYKDALQIALKQLIEKIGNRKSGSETK